MTAVGDLTFGDLTFGETTFDDLTVGEPTGHYIDDEAHNEITINFG